MSVRDIQCVDHSADNYIDQYHPSSLCAICDNPLFEHEPVSLAIAHGLKHFVHASCMENEMECEE